jgi:thymidylate synthase (FAD)
MLGNQAVLDSGFVELLDMMPHPATMPDGYHAFMAITDAARTSYLGEGKGYEKDKALLDYLIAHHHDSPLEMVQFKFRIYAPVVVWWQLVRHRTFSFNLQSGRYVEFGEDEFYSPSKWRKQATDNKQGSNGVLSAEDERAILDTISTSTPSLTELFNAHYLFSHRIYELLVAGGVAKEQARLFLPFAATYYTGVVSCDLRNLLHFIGLRDASEAQSEIRAYARAMREIVAEHLPELF